MADIGRTIEIHIDDGELDAVLEKASQLKQLLMEVKQLIDSLAKVGHDSA